MRSRIISHHLASNFHEASKLSRSKMPKASAHDFQSQFQGEEAQAKPPAPKPPPPKKVPQKPVKPKESAKAKAARAAKEEI